MRISTVMMATMAGGLAFAMPTQKELEDAAPVVQERLEKERQAIADGRKTRTEVADAAVIMAASAGSEAEKVLLLKGAFTFYVRDGQYGKASETLGALRIAIDRVSDETIDSLVKSVEGAVEPEDRPRFHRMMVAGLKSAKVDGVTWYYRETEKGIEIGTGLKNLAAVDERTSGRLVVPNEIRGKPVVSVGAGTLYGCTRVESVFIPKNAKSVMIAAFTGCSNLKTIEIDPDNPTYRSVGGLLADKAGTGIGRCPEGRRSVTVPKGIEKIYGGAFSDCGKLESVMLSDGLKQIDNGAFSRCVSLTSVKLPSSVTSIGETAFEGCDRLSPKPSGAADTDWQQGPSDDWFVDWDKALTESKKTNKPIFALSTGSDWCGWCKKLKKDVLMTEEFGNFAKKNLVLLYLDSPRKPLPEAQTLHNRTVCRELRLGGGVPCAAVFAADARRLGVLSGGGYTASNYVERLEKMLAEKGELPKSGQPSKIFTEGYAESERGASHGLKRQAKQDELGEKMLDKDSQDELKRLATKIKAEKLVKAGKEINAVKWTYEIVDGGVILGNAGERWVPAVSNRTMETLTIPETIDGKPVRGIGSGAFWRCTQLSSLNLPSSLRSIGYAAFEDCTGLTSLTIPSGVTNVSSRAFRNCTGLKSVAIPSAVKNIGNSAFSGCDGLMSISVENDNASFRSVDGIMYDKSMKVVWCCPGGRTGNVTIPDGVMRIGDSAFEGCKGLISVMIPQSVERLDSEAFRDCSGLLSVKIPSGVKRIGSQAFWGCRGLTSMVIPASVTDIAKGCSWGAFGCCDSLKSFTVDPANSAYSSRNGMLCSKDGVELIAGVNGDVVIPSGVTHIERGAFYGCKGLVSVTIPRGVVSIESSAFSHCAGLTSVTIPSGVSSIGYQAFSWNPNLRQVDIPASVRKIGDHAFIVCPKLTVIDIRGESVEIDRTAFGRDTPVGAKMPDLSKPVGPIHVVVGKDASGEVV